MYFLDCRAVDEEGQSNVPVRLFAYSKYQKRLDLSTSSYEKGRSESGSKSGDLFSIDEAKGFAISSHEVENTLWCGIVVCDWRGHSLGGVGLRGCESDNLVQKSEQLSL